MKILFTLMLITISVTSIAQQSKKKNSIEQQFVNTKWKCISDDFKEMKFEKIIYSKTHNIQYPRDTMIQGTTTLAQYHKKSGYQEEIVSFYGCFFDKDSIFFDIVNSEIQYNFRMKYTYVTKDIIVLEGFKVWQRQNTNIFDVKEERKNFTLIRDK